MMEKNTNEEERQKKIEESKKAFEKLQKIFRKPTAKDPAILEARKARKELKKKNRAMKTALRQDAHMALITKKKKARRQKRLALQSQA